MSNLNGESLPRGWEIVRLRDVVRTLRPKVLPSAFPDLKFIGMEHIEAHTTRLLATVPASTMKSSAVYFQPGDILYGRLRPYLNKVLFAKFAGLCSAEFIVLTSETGINAHLLQYLVNSSPFVSFSSSLNTGDRPRVDFEGIGDYRFALPPSAEQLRIVGAIESLLPKLDAAVAALERVRANLKRYRASVLKAAVEGRLVPTEADLARKEGRDFEPASMLLERILAERCRRWEESELARMKAAGKPPKDDRWKSKYKEPFAPDTSTLPQLPDGWCWATVGQLGSIESGQTPDGIAERAASSGDVPWYRVADMNSVGNEVTMSVSGQWLSWHSAAKLGLHIRPSGTIIFPKRGGAIATNKKRRLGQPSAYDLNTMGVIPRGQIGDYLWVWFNQLDLAALSDGSNVPQINHGDIQPLPVSLPPMAEQRRIVFAAENLNSVAEKSQRIVEDNLLRCTRLRQSILKWAFEGRLVDQDPNDEPASVLLERIRAERAAMPSRKSRKSSDHQTEAAK